MPGVAILKDRQPRLGVQAWGWGAGLLNALASPLELNGTAGSLPPATPLSPSAVPAQSLLMSSGVGGDASLTLTLADTQGLLSGALDTVTLNLASQVGAARLWPHPLLSPDRLFLWHFLFQV